MSLPDPGLAGETQDDTHKRILASPESEKDMAGHRVSMCFNMFQHVKKQPKTAQNSMAISGT